MSMWEITAGREDFVWYERPNGLKKGQSHWWVMTWNENGNTNESRGPYPVWAMEIGLLMFWTPPIHTIQFGDKTKVHGPAGDKMFYIEPKHIWARMPMDRPPVPNVSMFFLDNPSVDN